ASAAVAQTLLLTSAFYQDSANGLGGGGEEVAAAVPVLGPFAVHQPQVRLVDQGGGLQRLAWLFLCQLLGREFARLVVDPREQVPRGGRVTLLDGGQDTGDVAHAVKSITGAVGRGQRWGVTPLEMAHREGGWRAGRPERHRALRAGRHARGLSPP